MGEKIAAVFVGAFAAISCFVATVAAKSPY